MIEHTPGPWLVRPTEHKNGIPTVEIHHGWIGEVICTMESADNPADAHLIAAAPDLLAFARYAAARECAYSPPECPRAWGDKREYWCLSCHARRTLAVEKAIAKAEGRPV